MSRALKTNRLIRLFGVTKVPMIWYCRPKVIEHNDEKIEIQIPLKRRTKNHLGSMYFGVLAVGADITGGFLAMDPIQDSGRNIALIFKDFKADFLKRPEGDVHFICKDGLAIKELVDKVTHSTERHNYKLNIEAIVPTISTEVVAKFELTLSLKDKT
mgnify:FL=1|jgi:acyl-coenzyme A thioesterase PaaI-like protein